MLRGLFALLAFGVFGSAAWANSDTCGGVYTVKRGDSLSRIAEAQYRNARLWTEIYRNNLTTIGAEPDLLLIGQELWLTCIARRPVGLPGADTAAPEVARTAVPPLATLPPVWEGRPITLLTADNYAPFSDRDVPGGGLMTEIVSAAMDSIAPDTGYRIHWVNDRSAHLNPLLANAMLDMGFPWKRPDCATAPQAQGCAGLLFSDPVFEALVVLFSDVQRPVAYSGADSVRGLTLCRPAGFETHDLDRADSRWVTDGHIALVQPAKVEDCFDALIGGGVDGVALNEFTGRVTIESMGLHDRVVVAGDRPMSIETLHVVVDANHPRAAELLNTINEGLRRIRADGTYQAVLERQLDRIWAAF